MKDPFLLNSASIPISYALLLLEIMSDKGLESAELLKRSRIQPQALQQERITPKQWSRLAWESLQLADDTALGYEYGLRLRLTAHGSMGFALMSCAHLKQALELFLQFFSMRLRHYQVSFQETPDVSSLVISELHPVMAHQADQAFLLRRFFYECVMIGVVQTANFLTNESFISTCIDVDWPEPNYHQTYKKRLPAIHFNQPNNIIYFKTEMLHVPLRMADSVAYQQSLEQCKVEQLHFVQKISDIISRVKSELIFTPYQGYPTLDHVAERLAMSSRTLKRNLLNVGTSYSALLDEAKEHNARQLLIKSNREIQQIATYLGYEQPTNFTRAFKKWTGMSPSVFRAANSSITLL